jgi:general nucleoside transport system ATP-binding protein
LGKGRDASFRPVGARSLGHRARPGAPQGRAAWAIVPGRAPQLFMAGCMQIELRNIHKRFGAVHANAGISLCVPSSFIQGILGENGAGKSTLMKILSGFFLPDSGEILLDGSPVVIHSPADAIRHGIGMLHQDPLDFPPLKVLDDFILGAPSSLPPSGGNQAAGPRRPVYRAGLFPDRRRVAREMRGLMEQFGFALDLDAYVDTLTVGERQQLEIVRLLWLGARVLILDEPTTGISQPQKVKLFSTLKSLAGQGMTILFVSHKLEDVEFLCSRVAVLRQGELVGEAQPPYRTRELVRMMFGKEVSFGGRASVPPGRVVLDTKGFCLEGTRLQVNDVTLCARAGEVIGCAGMEGSGQSLFLQACAGLHRSVGGRIGLADRDVTGGSYLSYRSQGVAYLPAARLEQGLVPGLTLAEHFILSEGKGRMMIDRRAGMEMTAERIAAYNIKGAPEHVVEDLSGGNQQRMLLALLKESLSLILLEHPTRGLDIESTLYIWEKLKERCRQGAAIIFTSADLDEILQYSDRILVFFAGRVSPPLSAEQVSVETLGELIGGKGWERLSGDPEGGGSPRGGDGPGAPHA